MLLCELQRYKIVNGVAEVEGVGDDSKDPEGDKGTEGDSTFI